MSSRITHCNRSVSIATTLRILAASLTLTLLIALQPEPASAQSAGIYTATEGSYETTAYKKKRRYRKRRYNRKKRYRKRRKSTPVVAWPNNKGPVQLIISIPDQRMTLYKAGKKVASSRVSTGKAGHRTPTGIFSVIQKHRRHYSNLYGGAPMPNMQRITWSGIAMHAGSLPGYPASHGCIRLPYSFARKLFGYTEMGNHVIVTRSNIAPKFITHSALFQPIPAAVNVGPRVVLEKQTMLDAGVAGQNTPLISNLTTGRGTLTNTAATVEELDTSTSATARDTTNNVLKKLAALENPAMTDQTPDTQSILRRHLIQKMRNRQWPKDVQRLLKNLGIYRGNIDGDLGNASIRAIKRFQRGMAMPVTGKVNKELILVLHRISGRTIDLSFKNVKLPKSDAPLRILITRKKAHETATITQKMLNQLGYDTNGIDGHLGKQSVIAMRNFQTDQNMKVTGRASPALLDALYKATGTTKPGEWHLYVRQEFLDMFDAPVDVRNSSTPMGTHLFTAMHFDKDATQAEWTSLTMRASSGRAKRKCRWNRRKRRRTCRTIPAPMVSSISAAEALDRVEIPADIKNIVSELLTPGSSMTVTDNGISYETGKGTDFIVLTK